MKKSLFIVLSTVVVMLNLGNIVHSQSQESLVDLPGRIAYIGADFNLYTLNLHNETTIPLTQDGSNPIRRYTWPTWSETGELAYFCCEGRSTVEIYLSEDGLTTGELVYEGDDEAFTYANWSPRRCDTTDDCRDLAVLLSQIDEAAFDVRLIRHGETTSSSTVVDTSTPFYYSWNPEGNQLLNFRNETTLEIYDVESGEANILNYDPGLFQAPEWSPVDDRLLVGLQNEDGETTDLTIIANNETIALVTEIPGLVAFNWSPDGNYIAYSSPFETGANLLFVIDAITGEIIAQTIVDTVFAFFWSPDSNKLAYVTTAAQQGTFSAKRAQQTNGLAWGVLDVEANEARRYANFIPTRQMIYMLNFFNQFSQSHSIWSPDSTHIVFGEQIDSDERIVNILDVTRTNSTPFAIAEGVIGIWSYDE